MSSIRRIDSVLHLPLVDDEGICRGIWLSGIPIVAVLVVFCELDGRKPSIDIELSKEAETLVASRGLSTTGERPDDDGSVVAACVFKDDDAGFDPNTHDIALVAETGLNCEVCRVDITIRHQQARIN